MGVSLAPFSPSMAICRPLVDLGNIFTQECSNLHLTTMSLCVIISVNKRWDSHCILLWTELLDRIHTLATFIHSSSVNEVAVNKLWSRSKYLLTYYETHGYRALENAVCFCKNFQLKEEDQTVHWELGVSYSGGKDKRELSALQEIPTWNQQGQMSRWQKNLDSLGEVCWNPVTRKRTLVLRCTERKSIQETFQSRIISSQD